MRSCELSPVTPAQPRRRIHNILRLSRRGLFCEAAHRAARGRCLFCRVAGHADRSNPLIQLGLDWGRCLTCLVLRTARKTVCTAETTTGRLAHSTSPAGPARPPRRSLPRAGDRDHEGRSAAILRQPRGHRLGQRVRRDPAGARNHHDRARWHLHQDRPTEVFTTNLCFGGKDMCDAWITLSGGDKPAKARWSEPGRRLHFNA